LGYGGGPTRVIGKPSTNSGEHSVRFIGNEKAPIHVNDAIAGARLETD
jgi:hypothetical protein